MDDIKTCNCDCHKTKGKTLLVSEKVNFTFQFKSFDQDFITELSEVLIKVFKSVPER